MDYKQTLFLPTTTFPMRGNLPAFEQARYDKWQQSGEYNKMKRSNSNKQSFTLHDGPPYANGHTHIGHALNKILKDIIVKQHFFAGYAVRFTPGWDCHGLPIEQQVEKSLGDKKQSVDKKEIRKLCREHAKKFVEIQKEEFRSLGVVADWDTPYITMDYKIEAEIYRELCRVAKAGLLIERKKPVFWSWAAQSALAEAEVEYEEKESDSIFVAFSLDDDANKKISTTNARAVIWTTTPWTLPANVAIALNPDESYVLTSNGFLVARARYDQLIKDGVISGEIIKQMPSSDLEGLKAINPLNGNKSLLILGSHVTMEDGTGLVHTAPGHGEDDYVVAFRYNLPVVMPVDERGCYDNTILREKLLPESFLGMHIFKANPLILEMLSESLLKHTTIKHSYPHCWRTGKPIIFRATKQWFIAMDQNYNQGATLRESALKEIDGVRFYPESGGNRLSAMVGSRPDWCISRQREWGVPIAFFRDKTTGEVIYDEALLQKIASVFEQDGCDAWVIHPNSYFLPEGSKLDPNNLEKVQDILDVWFDSGSTQASVLKSGHFDAGTFPADLYLEGSDQHRGWFQSSLLTSVATSSKAPFKAILTHGFTVDEKGNKMSKSKGNVVAPSDVIKTMGSEILRLWVALSDYRAEVKISQNILKQVSEIYKKLRNTFRFMLANISDLEKPVDLSGLGALDLWIISRAKEVFNEAQSAFAEFDFAKGYHKINSFIIVEFSGIYLDLVKDRIYCDELNSPSRRSAQSAIYMIARSLLTLVAPVLTYTADEIVEHAPAVLKADKSTIFDYENQSLPTVSSNIDGSKLLEIREQFFERIDKLKKDGVIKNTLEIEVKIDGDLFASLSDVDLADLLTVSKVTRSNASNALEQFVVDDSTIFITTSTQHKCPRCWKFVSANDDELCDRCAGVINA